MRKGKCLRWAKKGMAVTLSMAMTFGVVGGTTVLTNVTQQVVKAASGTTTGTVTVQVLDKVNIGTPITAGTVLYVGTGSTNYDGQLPTAISAKITAHANTGTFTDSSYIFSDVTGKTRKGTIEEVTAVDVNIAASNFDGCKTGAIYPKSDTQWAYNCSGNGADNVDITVYKTENVDATVTVKLKDDLEPYPAGKATTVDKSAISSIELSYMHDGVEKTSQITDYKLLDNSVGSVANGVVDNKITVGYGLNYADTITLEVPMTSLITDGSSGYADVEKETVYNNAAQADVVLTDAKVKEYASYSDDGKTNNYSDWSKYITGTSYDVDYKAIEEFGTYSKDTYTKLADNVAQNKIAENIIHAGTYKVTGTVNYQVGTYKSARTYTYTVTVDQAGIVVKNPIDYVESTTVLSDHETKINISGKNNEKVVGVYTYDSTKTVNADDVDEKNIAWEFALPEAMNRNDYKPAPVNGTNGRVIFKLKDLPTDVTVDVNSKEDLEATYGDTVTIGANINKTENYGTASDEEEWSYTILDENNQIVKAGTSKDITDPIKNDGSVSFDVDGLDAGIYTVKIEYQNGYTTTDEENITVSGSKESTLTIKKRTVAFKKQINLNKIYDGSTLAYKLNQASVQSWKFDGNSDTLSNLVSGDQITITAEGNYDTKDVSAADNSNTITWDKVVLSGNDTDNYVLDSNYEAATGKITAADLKVSMNPYFYLTKDKTTPDVKDGVGAKTSALLLAKVDENGAFEIGNVELKEQDVDTLVKYELVDDSYKPTSLTINEDGAIVKPSTITTNDNINDQDVWPTVKVALSENTNYDYQKDYKVPYAVLGEDIYDIILENMTGATINDSDWVPTYVYKKYGMVAKPLPTNVTRTGYAFDSWTTLAGGLGVPVTAVEVGSEGTKTFYANWTAITYDITYNLNGGVNGDNIEAYNIEKDTITLKDPSKEGYNFAGWYTTSDFKDGTKITEIKKGSHGDIELYAKWEKIPVSGVELNKKDITMKPGDSTTIKVTVKPSDTLDKEVTWKSSDSKIATVDKNGNVIALKSGTVTITVTSKDGKHTVTCKIRVKKSHLVLSGNPKTSKTVKTNWFKLKNADGYEIYGNVCGSKSKYIKKVGKITTTTFSKVAGKSLKKGGRYKFYVKGFKMINGKKVYLATSNVIHIRTVNSYKEANAISVTANKKTASIKVGKTTTVKGTAKLPKGKKQMKGHGAYFQFISSDTDIATVSAKGVITGKKAGKCTVYVLAINGKYAKVTVTVK